jgi:hypothetical protein
VDSQAKELEALARGGKLKTLLIRSSGFNTPPKWRGIKP